jgi:hypothetical protein
MRIRAKELRRVRKRSEERHKVTQKAKQQTKPKAK